MAIETLTVDLGRSSIRFSLRHLVFAEISGNATRFHGEARFDTVDAARSSVNLVIDAGSLTTGDPERDEHIRSPEFLNAERYPEIRFQSRRITRAEDGHYRMLGDLTIRDVTREASLAIEDRGRGSDASTAGAGRFTAHATIDRRDFGLRWNQDLDTGGVVVGDRIKFEISLVLASTPAADLLPPAKNAALAVRRT